MPPRSLDTLRFRKLSEDQFAPAREVELRVAEALLGSSPWCQISAAQAAELTDAALRIGPTDVIVLLRGVEAADQPEASMDGGAWSVTWKDGVVIVSHMSMRSFPWELRRRHPVVAVLDAVPTEVYVMALVVF